MISTFEKLDLLLFCYISPLDNNTKVKDLKIVLISDLLKTLLCKCFLKLHLLLLLLFCLAVLQKVL